MKKEDSITLEQALLRIQALEKEMTQKNAMINELRVSGIHTCNDKCKRAECVLRNELEKTQNTLQLEMKDSKRLNEQIKKYKKIIQKRNKQLSKADEIILDIHAQITTFSVYTASRVHDWQKIRGKKGSTELKQFDDNQESEHEN